MVTVEFHNSNLKKRNLKNKIFSSIVYLSVAICFLALLWLFYSILSDTFGWLNLSFLLNFPSRHPEIAGIFPGLVGSLILIILIAIMAVPIGVGAAIYLEEYANKKSFVYRFVDLCISNLSGVPSIIYGVLGLGIFSYFSFLKGSILSGAIILSLLILPVVIVSSQEALKSVPNSLKEASFGLGMTKWQMIVCVVLPYAIPGILTGVILALSRAIGEGAPLIVVGAATLVTKLPTSLTSSFTAMPILVFYWSGLPRAEFQNVAATGSVVLIIVLLLLNSIAIYIRNKYQKKL